MYKGLSKILNLILTQRCAHCKKNYVTNSSLLCQICDHLVTPLQKNQRCSKCLEQLVEGNCVVCENRKLYFASLSALFLYKGPARTLFKEAKFRNRKSAFKKIFSHNCALPPNTLVIALPSSRNFVKKLVSHLNPQSSINLFKKKNITMKNLNQAQRFLKAADSIELIDDAISLDYDSYLLVDDAWTTGATLNQAAYLLHQLGVEHSKIKGLVAFRRDRYQLGNSYDQ